MKLRVLQETEQSGKSFNSDLIAAWLTAGGKLVEKGGFQQYQADDGKVHVRWLVNCDQLAVVDGQRIEFDEFRERFQSQDWCVANPDSDIAFMRAFRDNARDLKRFAKTASVGVAKQAGNSFGIMYPESPEWLKNEFAARFA